MGEYIRIINPDSWRNLFQGGDGNSVLLFVAAVVVVFVLVVFVLGGKRR